MKAKLYFLSLVVIFTQNVYATCRIDNTSIEGHSLVLNQCHLKDSDMMFVVNFLNTRPDLDEVWLNSNNISTSGIKTLTQLSTVKILHLSNDSLNDESAIYLSRNLHFHELDLEDNNIADEGAKALASANLTNLSLYKNSITDVGAFYLANSATLKTLNLMANKVGHEGVKAFSENKLLTTLELSKNDLDDDDAIVISKNSVIKNLMLADNKKIGDKGAVALANNTNIKWLDLDFDNVGDDGAIALSKNTALRWLWLQYNKINKLGIIALRTNHTLEELNVHGNPGVKSINSKLEKLRQTILKHENR